MPRREIPLRLADIRLALDTIGAYTAGFTFEQFAADRRTVDAVVRNLTIIGEASARLPEEFCARHSAIPWTEMRILRNFLVHEYFGVSDRIIWDTVIHNLPPVQAALADLPGAAARPGRQGASS